MFYKNDNYLKTLQKMKMIYDPSYGINNLLLILFLQMNSVYGLLSTEVIHSLPKVLGPAYLPLYPGYVYAALPATNEKLVSEIRSAHFG